MPAEYTCDKCGSQDGAQEDWDGEILCSYHKAEKEMSSEMRAYIEKRDWVKRIHFKDLCERRERIAKLKAFLTKHEPDAPQAQSGSDEN